jgi:hypothetical protein
LSAFGAKRTWRNRRGRIHQSPMTQSGHEWPLLLQCTAPDLLYLIGDP